MTNLTSPTGSNADEWALFLEEHSVVFAAVQIATRIEALERVDQALYRACLLANEHSDKHLTIFRVTTGWQAMLKTPDLDSGLGRDQLKECPKFKSLPEALDALEKPDD
jgi:hypothetical protein